MIRLVLGTRGSDLARAQTAMVQAALASRWPEVEVAIEIITTRGDENSGCAPEPIDRRAGRKGLFTGEIERALHDRRIDVAVHSAKDLPSDASDGLEICAALPRAPVEDLLIAKSAASCDALAQSAVIGTGSVRRQHQLRSLRPDLEIVELRGNVPTRLRKLIANPWEATVLARAGIERLGFDCARGELSFEGQVLRSSILPTEQFLPAGGQGIVALQVRSDDAVTRSAITAINHSQTLLCLRAEREFLRLLEGDCDSPVGVFAAIEGKAMTLRAQVFTLGENEPRADKVTVRASFEHQPEAVASALFQWMYGEEN